MSERFELAHAIELQPHLAQPEGKNTKTRRIMLRKVVSNIIVNNPEMLTLYPEILHCLQSSDSEIKRMCLLYLETYVKSRPKQIPETLERLSREVTNDSSSTGIRAVALRTLSSIPAKSFATNTLELIPQALKSQDPYFRKTACFAAAKAWATSRADVEKSGVLGRLNQMLIKEPSPVVVAAAAQALISITEQSNELDFVIDFNTAKRLAAMIGDCPEFSQVSLLAAIQNFTPQSSEEAEELAKYITPGLRHTNAAVAIGTARVLMMLGNYSRALSASSVHSVFGPLLSQLNRPPEIQYSVLRNIQLLLLAVDPETLKILKIPPQTFFCKGSDLPYIRATKIDILSVLCTPSNADTVVKELIEFIHVRDDAAAQRRAITALAKLASKFEEIAPRAVQVFKQVLHHRSTGGEASSNKAIETEETTITELVNLVRRYTQNAQIKEQVLTTLLELRELPVGESARCSYIWLLGSNAPSPGRILNSFVDILEKFQSESSAVQLTLMTACIKAHARFPREMTQRLVPRIFEIAASQSADPDVRDRALFYWRLLSQNIEITNTIVASPLPPIINGEHAYDYSQIEDLELSMGYLSSIYLKPAEKLFRVAPTRQLKASPALLPRKLNKLRELAPSNARSPNASRAASASSASLSLQNQHSLTPMASGYFNSPPAPPVPRPQNLRQTSLNDQFQGLSLQPTPQDIHERLIDL